MGLAAMIGVTLLMLVIDGSTGALAAATFAGVAVGLQLLAGVVTGRFVKSRGPDLMREHAIGMAFRVFGVALIAVAVTVDRATFPPGACAVGYLGAVLPLLWLETRLV